jgi:hypothetical protein
MSVHDEEYRIRLLEAVRHINAQQEALEMTDQQLEASICSQLGLPLGTTFTDEQLQMIAKHP